MIDEKLKSELTGLRFEIIDLNTLSYFYVRKLNRSGYLFKETGREFILEEFIALRYLENGLILHLTNLDDDGSNYSFRSARKLINATNIAKNQKTLNTLNNKITSYRKNINRLKTEHRNKRIAHINSIELPGLDEFLNFESYLKPLVLQANEIGDFIWGKEINVKFKLGSHEGILDFRKLNKELVVDLEKTKGFR